MNEHYPFQNPPLPYPVNAMEPYIGSLTMQIHHDKHLQTYINNLNGLLSNMPTLQNLSLENLVIYSARLPEKLKEGIANNAGGVYNHIFYFEELGRLHPMPLEQTSMLIDKHFMSFENFKKLFKEAALSVFGSGYAWLALDHYMVPQIVTTKNQDITFPLKPILNIDVWEHAYYLKNYNDRAKYIDNWFNVINWKVVEERLKLLLMRKYDPNVASVRS